MSEGSYTVKNFPPTRQATVDLLTAASRKHMIHGLIEVDVTRLRRRMSEIKSNTGESISFTGYIIYCCAQAVGLNKHMQAYRDWRGRLILFDEVDVSTAVERQVGGKKRVIPTIIRSANQKSVAQIHADIRRAQNERPEEAGVFQAIRLYLLIPAFIRGWFFRILDRAPHLMKKNGGTIMVTSVGMFGRGAGWGLPVASHTLNVTVGSIVPRLMMIDGNIEEREHLCLTISFNHDLVDGAPAARFIQQFKELIESAIGLEDETTPDQSFKS
jgi:pyruvate/2-oxoglutarate dehydrogenase complex dihydrolipoamide acyltransferase (E2) component